MFWVIISKSMPSPPPSSAGFSLPNLQSFCTESSAGRHTDPASSARGLELPAAPFSLKLSGGSALRRRKTFAHFSQRWLVLKGSLKKQVEGAFYKSALSRCCEDRTGEEWEEDVGVAHHSVEDEDASFLNLCRTDRPSSGV